MKRKLIASCLALLLFTSGCKGSSGGGGSGDEDVSSETMSDTFADLQTVDRRSPPEIRTDEMGGEDAREPDVPDVPVDDLVEIKDLVQADEVAPADHVEAEVVEPPMPLRVT